MEVFKIGELVKVIKGRNFVGTIGEINAIYEYEKGRFIYSVEIDQERLISVFHWNLKKVNNKC